MEIGRRPTRPAALKRAVPGLARIRLYVVIIVREG